MSLYVKSIYTYVCFMSTSKNKKKVECLSDCDETQLKSQWERKAKFENWGNLGVSLLSLLRKYQVFFETNALNSPYKEVAFAKVENCVPRAYIIPCLLSHSVMNDSVQPLGLLLARLLCPWNFPGKIIGVGCHFLLHGIFLTQGSNSCLLHLLHWPADSLPVGHLGSLISFFKN